MPPLENVSVIEPLGGRSNCRVIPTVVHPRFTCAAIDQVPCDTISLAQGSGFDTTEHDDELSLAHELPPLPEPMKHILSSRHV